MPRCKDCEARVPSGANYCPECGEKVKKSRDRDQQVMGKQSKKMQTYIDYLQDEMADAGIKFDSLEDYED